MSVRELSSEQVSVMLQDAPDVVTIGVHSIKPPVIPILLYTIVFLFPFFTIHLSKHFKMSDLLLQSSVVLGARPPSPFFRVCVERVLMA